MKPVLVDQPRPEAEAMQYLQPGDRIVVGQACGEPRALLEALIDAGPTIGGLSVFLASSFSDLLAKSTAASFEVVSMGAIGSLKALADEHRLSIIPAHVSQLNALIADGLIGCDVVLLQVSPADANGYHSLGLSSDYLLTATAKARIVIAEINDQIPFTYGTHIHRSKIHIPIKVSYPPAELHPAPAGPIEMAIGRGVARYIEDRAVIQTGVGSVPDAVLKLIADRKDLGVHSGMISDGILDLIECGAITNAAKPIDTGVSVTCALAGTKRLYDFAHCNPKIEMRPGTYTHNAAVLTRITRLVAINSAIEVDLTGQVNAEQSGDRYLGGTGGQVDFSSAALRSPGGRSIVALPSTALSGRASRISAQLSGPVTTPRTDVDVVVTEYGSAELRGRSLAERARRMTQIAHPDFQAELDKAAFDIARRGF